jgi:type IV secretory pathway VirB2 component (pilin)
MKTGTYELNKTWKAVMVAMFVVLVTALPDLAFAYNSDLGYVICNAAYLFTGNAGKGLATIGISILGVGALLGKVSWGLAIVVGVGIALIFYAPGIIVAIGGPGGC